MDALDYKTTDHRWGGPCSRFVPICPRLRTKVEQKQIGQKNKRWTLNGVTILQHCCINITVAIVRQCCAWATVWQLCSSGVAIVSQCCRIATNIFKVCVWVPIGHSLALKLQGMRLVNGCIYRYAFNAYGPRTLYGARWCALEKD